MRYILILIFYLIMGQAHAASVEELQELNLAKAELAIGDGDFKKAARIIQRNLIKKKFHLASYQFLINLYLSKESYSKAFRVYYFLIKRVHGSKVLYAGDRRALNLAFKQSKKPNKEALAIYYDIAKTYYNLHEKQVFKNEKRPLFMLNMANKYFNVCLNYKFNEAESRYYLGLIQKAKQNYGQAIYNFLEAKDLFQEEKNPSISDELDFLVGETLIRSGFTDAGSIYLQSVSSIIPDKNQTGGSLRDYAGQYLESLYSENFSVFSFSYGFSNNDNVHTLSESDLEDFEELYKDSFDSKNGSTRDLTLSYYFNSKQVDHFQYIVSSYFVQNEYTNQKIAFQDIRSFGSTFEIRYDNLIKSLARFSYSVAKTNYRPKAEGAYESLSLSHTFSLSYGHLLKTGYLTIRFPLTLNDSKVSENTESFGVEVSYIPYDKSKYFKPSYSFEITNNDETDGLKRSIELSPSFTNHFQIAKNKSLFATLTYTQYLNENSATGFNEYQGNLSYSHVFKFWQKLSASGSYNYRVRNQDDNEKINESVLSASLTTSF